MSAVKPKQPEKTSLKGVLQLLALVVGAVVTTGGGYLATNAIDEPLLNTSLLQPNFRSLPSAQNLIVALNKLPPLKADPLKTPALIRIWLEIPAKWDETKAKALLNQAKPALAAFAEAALLNDAVNPNANAQSSNINDYFPLSGNSIEVARLLTLQAEAERRQKDSATALKTSQKLLHVGEVLSRQPVGLSEWRVGQAILAFGSDSLRRIIASSQDQTLLAEQQQYLQTIKLDLGQLKTALKGELAFAGLAMAQAIADPSQVAKATGDQTFENAAKWAKLPLFGGYFYKPNQTTNRFIAIHSTLQLPSSDCSLVTTTPVAPFIEPILLEAKSANLATPNMAGKILLQMLIPNMQTALSEACTSISNLNALKITLALRRFLLKQQKLPTELTELVPALLDSLPLDPYNAKAFVFDRQKRLLKDAAGKAWGF
jgi:hypothetical protein